MEVATAKHAHRFILQRLNNVRLVRTQVLVWFFTVAIVLAAVAAQFVIGSRTFSSDNPIKGGTYVEGVVGSLDSLNPLQASSSAEVAASRLMFSSLYKYDASGRLHEDLADSLSVNKSGEVYTVKLREDVLWHDGRELTADDVLYTIGLITDPESRSRASLRANWQDIEVEKLNTYTVKFTLPAYAAFPHALTFPVVPKHILQDTPAGVIPESSFASAPIGSGPFRFRLLQNADIASNHRAVHMVAHEEYYDSVPKINRFELHAYPDAEMIGRALKSREVTAASGVDQSVVQSIENSGYETAQYTIDNGVYLLMNTTNATLKDIDIRRALQRGVDVAKVRDKAGENLKPLNLPFFASYFDDTKLPEAPTHNQRAAAQLLDKAGWKLSGTNKVRQKAKKPLQLTLTTIKNEQFEAGAEEIAEQLRALGVEVNVSIIDDTQPGSNFRQNILQQRNYDILLYELPIGADPDVYAYWHSSQLGASGYNFTNYSNSVSDAALASARDRTEENLRRAKYVTFARQWLSDAPAIGLYQQVSYYVYNKNATTVPDNSLLVMSSDRYSSVPRWTVDRGQVYKTP